MSNPYAVVIDSNVLAKGLHRNVLLNLAAAECFRPIWSDTILVETEVSITKMGGDGPKRRRQLEAAFPGALADPSYIHLVRLVHLEDEDDRHVVAVALQENADAICTENLRDFGLSTVDVLTPDEFITDTIDLSPVRAISALAQMRARMTSIQDGQSYVDLLADRGLVEAAQYLRPYAERL
ncbi:PIN domain-containing protein [Sulfitobacter sp. 1A12126]|uniref:PIN domain-containing protein n=1 Tax=Sulfitobacter sp. 1A12126 TaxID=3368591 RepID=UPI003745CE5A